MEQFIIDTNVLSDYMSGSLPESGLQFLDDVIDLVPQISIISQIELLCWNTDAYTTQKVSDFIADCQILQINSEVIAHCVALRKTRKVKTPDAIIAATALAQNQTLITNNEKDFKGISGLKVINPHKL